jgi:hypothetical protein
MGSKFSNFEHQANRDLQVGSLGMAVNDCLHCLGNGDWLY